MTAFAVYLSLGGIPPKLLLAGSEVAAALDAPGLATRMVETAAESRVGGRDTVEALVRVAGIYRLRGRHAEAFAYLTRARLMLERAVGSRNRGLAPILDRLALVSVERGDFESAAAFENRGLMIRTAAYGADDPRVALNLEDLADVRRMEGRLSEAMRLARGVLARRERSLRERSTYLARALGRIGAIYREQGNLEMADLYLERALKLIAPAVLNTRVGKDSDRLLLARAHEAARILTEAGVLRTYQGRYGAARRLLVQSFRLYTGATPKQAEVLRLLAETYRREGLYRVSLAHLRIALCLSEEAPRIPVTEGRIRKAMDALRHETGIAERATRDDVRASEGGRPSVDGVSSAFTRLRG